MSVKQAKSSWFIRGHQAWDGGDARAALRFFLEGAKRKDASCQQNVGYFYDEGLGVAPNCRKAMWWYARSARQGSSSGAYNLGLLYARKGSIALAKRWFKVALDLGETDARLRLTELQQKRQKVKTKIRDC
jgi:TPR repeat protein